VNGDPTANFNAINKCYKDAKAQGAQVEIPAGKYRYKGTLVHDAITVFNNGELQGADPDSGYYMKNANPRLIGGKLSHEGNTVRLSQMYHHGIGLYDQTGEFEIIDVHIVNPAAAGICIWDGRDGRILGCTIEDSLADGMHHVASQDGSSGNIYERGNVVKRAGDDCLSFVTYGEGAPPVYNCEIWNFRGEDNTWGRGITILGAKDIVINNAVLNRIKCFGLFCGAEEGFGGAGSYSQAQFNDVKLDVCGSWSSNADCQDGVLISGWTNTTVCDLKDVVLSRPMRHGVLRYHSTGNEFAQDNVIYNAIPGQEVYTVGAPAGQSYSYPRRFERFEGPRRD
jgi:hypothetical protein